MKEARIIYTKEVFPLILEAVKDSLGIEDKGDHVIWEGRKIMKDDIIGFQKDIGIITKMSS